MVVYEVIEDEFYKIIDLLNKHNTQTKNFLDLNDDGYDCETIYHISNNDLAVSHVSIVNSKITTSKYLITDVGKQLFDELNKENIDNDLIELKYEDI